MDQQSDEPTNRKISETSDKKAGQTAPNNVLNPLPLSLTHMIIGERIDIFNGRTKLVLKNTIAPSMKRQRYSKVKDTTDAKYA